MDSLHSHVVFVALVFLLAGMVKGVVGMGLPTVAMGLLGLWMSPAEAAALLALPSLVTNVQQACGRHTLELIRRLWPMLACVAVATALGAGVITGHDPTVAGAGLGALLMLYAVFGLAQWQFRVPPRAERWAGPLVGG
ncbi:TSUP family transporter, partial [Xanthomonas sp. Kuri4-1]